MVVVVAITQSSNSRVILAGYMRLLPFLTGTLSGRVNTSLARIGGVGALPDSILLTKDPGCKNFYNLGTEPVTFDETLHAAPKW